MSKTNGRESLIPRANREAINVQARYLDGNDSPEDHVEGHLGPHGDLLVQGDLDGDAEHCPVLNKDWERLDAHHIKSERLRTAICNKIWFQYLSIFDKMLVCSVLLMRVDNVVGSGKSKPPLILTTKTIFHVSWRSKEIESKVLPRDGCNSGKKTK